MEHLPNEILELICSDPTPFVNAYARYAVSRTCRTLYAALGSASNHNWNPGEKTAAKHILLGDKSKTSPILARSLARLGCFDWLASAYRQGFAFDHGVATNAAKGGHLDCLTYCVENKFEVIYSSVQIEAARNGHLDCLKYACKHIFFMHDNYLSDTPAILAASNGHIDCLTFLSTICRAKWNYGVCASAAENGHLHCLQYAHQHGFIWSADDVITKAAINGHLDCMMYAYQNGGTCTREAALNAAAGGHLNCLVYVSQHGVKCNNHMAAAAASHGHLDCLMYILQNGADCTYEMAIKAASHGYIDCLRYMLEKYPEVIHKENRRNSICVKAAANGPARDRGSCGNKSADHLACLRYAHEAGCKMSNLVAVVAAANNHLDCLTYCHEHGCILDRDILLNAAEHGSATCLQYICENYSDVTKPSKTELMKINDTKCLVYLKMFLK